MFMRRCILFFFLGLIACKNGQRQSSEDDIPVKNPSILSVTTEVWASPIKQQISGTCWAYSTASFLESEIYRIKGLSIDLSEMYFVYNAYKQKAQNYILR